MFDYQAGEKYKTTLMMTGIAGIVIGIFFTLLIMPQAPDPHVRRSHGNVSNRDATNRDDSAHPGYIEGMREYNNKYNQGDPDDANDTASPSGQTSNVKYEVNSPQTSESTMPVDVNTATTLIERWLPLSWDLSANSAKFSQEKAITYMTNQCANQYRKHIWTKTISEQIVNSGIVSHFKLLNLKANAPNADGSVTICVQAEQELDIPGKGSKARDLSVEYMVVQTTNGPRIASITESNS